ncbi:TetR/AcrR family transcriptional regulator [Mycetocola tolaasinivorans]|uniref:TetR/AcrR family transcriptional regulator n=1 Tax=Mycetocola tolaasinivorans TaxID=76635 RepID=A0A3L7ACS6_9MICO|nr:TetR/AcrR family transcriptional regulator [Mycetocola tolaasinivorans]RLP78027.1 TetR/AcrR family transcriptional regulator [Mycetocola tolaasinivorans]
MVDARIRATRAALDDAIIALASAEPLGGLTVSQITAAAGINRATFYRHAESPTDLLARVLSEDLDQIRADDWDRRTERANGSLLGLIGESVEQVADHVERFALVYRHAFAEPTSGAARYVLINHFTESCERLLATGDSGLVPPIPPALISRFLAYGFTGAVDAWTAEGSTISRAEFVAGVHALFPAWWS